MRAAALILALSATLACAIARADATLVLQTIDDPGEGFNDPTPVAPVGGNSGQTLGEQRRIAVQFALDLWGAALDSDVPIVVQANFAELGCDSAGSAVLASAAPTTAVDRVTSRWADRDMAYPSALADRLLGTDAVRGEADIAANFNSSIDLPSCAAGVRWYYGTDGNGSGVDLVQTTLHELAHGLGMTLLVEQNTGALLLDKADPFTALAFDHTLAMHLSEMSNSQRQAALSHARAVVFDGPRTRQQAALFLGPQSPQLLPSPPVPAFSGLVADTNFGPALTATGVTAPLVEAIPNDGCATITNARGNIVLVRPVCFPDQTAVEAGLVGALGIVFGFSEHWQTPPSPLDLVGPQRPTIPVMVVSAADADALAATASTSGLTVTMTPYPARRAGTDDEGRPYLNATNPVTTSMLTHWDMSARPNLLMEPFVRPVLEIHSLDLTLPALQDVGWANPCGNGVLDAGEACDEGADNSATTADACRLDCSRAVCGDGVVDTGETCDEGADNGLSGRCPAGCGAPSCAPDCAGTGGLAAGGTVAGGGNPAPGGGPACGGVDCAGGSTSRGSEGGCGCRVASGAERLGGARLPALLMSLAGLHLRRRYRRRAR